VKLNSGVNKRILYIPGGCGLLFGESFHVGGRHKYRPVSIWWLKLHCSQSQMTSVDDCFDADCGVIPVGNVALFWNSTALYGKV
jgi:hypothetical protein